MRRQCTLVWRGWSILGWGGRGLVEVGWIDRVLDGTGIARTGPNRAVNRSCVWCEYVNIW